MERLLWQLRLEKQFQPSGLLRLLQDIAAEDAARRGGGQALLNSRGCTWVLVKNRLTVTRWPQAGETVCLTTWPLRGRFGLYPRAFELLDSAGKLIARADSVWAIIDTENRRMFPGEERDIVLQGVEEGHLAPQRRIIVPEGGTLFDLTPSPEQIDGNGHMNNAAYLDAAETMLPPELRRRTLTAIAIDYEHELLPGHHAQVRVVREGDACFFEGSMEEKVCFRMKLTY